MREVATGSAVASAFPAQWLKACSALSLASGLVSRHRLKASRFADLIPASGDQDHAAWPSASAPFVLRRPRVHRIPPPRIVTIAKRPSHRGGTGAEYAQVMIFGKRKLWAEAAGGQDRVGEVGEFRRFARAIWRSNPGLRRCRRHKLRILICPSGNLNAALALTPRRSRWKYSPARRAQHCR
jgi:hypothetical protein